VTQTIDDPNALLIAEPLDGAQEAVSLYGIIPHFDCPIEVPDYARRPSLYDVESSERAFCCGGIRNPCTTPGCTECGTHCQPLESAGAVNRPWCIPPLARCTEAKSRTTCEVCRRRIGLEPLPTCTNLPPFAGCEMSFVVVFLRLSEVVRLSEDGPTPTEATTSLVVSDDDCEVRAHQDGTVEVLRAAQVIARGRWGKRGLRRVDGVVSGIQQCSQPLIDRLNDMITFFGEGPLENDCDVCPKCGADTIDGYGLAGGGMGFWRICGGDDCDFFEKPKNETFTDTTTDSC
jgi:hypothetical protein